jgi:hypothetical protein
MRCRTCGRDNPTGNRFCSACGSPLDAQAPAGTAQEPVDRVPEPPPGLTGLLVFLACAVIAAIAWEPLSLPSRILDGLLPKFFCSGIPEGTTQMYWCSAAVGLRTIAVPVALMLLVVRFRAWLASLVRTLIPRLPPAGRSYVAPGMATLVFVLVWSGAHFAMASEVGILPQRLFPAVIGLFTYLVTAYRPRLQRALGAFFETRDRLPRWLWVAVAVGVPLAVSLTITRGQVVTRGPLKEQFVVLVGLGIGYLVLTPTGGAGRWARPQTGTPPWTPQDTAWRRAAAWVAVGWLLKILRDLLWPDAAAAGDCSAPSDCMATAGYNATQSVGGGLLGVSATVIGTSMQETISEVGGRIGVSLDDLLRQIQGWRTQSLSTGGRLPEMMLASAGAPPTWQEIIEKLQQVPGAGGGQGPPPPDLREILGSGKTARAVIIGLIAAVGAAAAAVSLPWILAIGAAAGLADKYGPDAFDVIDKFLAPGK